MSGTTSRASLATPGAPLLPRVVAQPRPEALVVEELLEPLLAAALAIDELRLVELRVEVVLGLLPAHPERVLEAELRRAQDGRVLAREVQSQLTHLIVQPLARHGEVDEPHRRRPRPVERPPGHDVEERIARADRLGQ